MSTAGRAGIRHKVVLVTNDGALSQGVAAGLAELIEPPADAVTRFEVGKGWRVEAYFTGEPDAGRLAAQLGALLGIAAPPFALEEVPDENWVTVSQAALPPVVAGRFTIFGSHDRARVPRGPNAIEIEAGEAFGTAHHATTLGCLKAIDRLARGRRFGLVLDLGCGTGVLAIAARRTLPRAMVTASDNDPVAVAVARANARHNGAGGIRAVVADGVPRRGQGRARYDLVVANILAGPLVRLAPDIAGAVSSGGQLVLSGLLVDQAREVSAAYLARGFRLERHVRIAGWSTLTLLRTATRRA